jgi:ApbE superfamily uncharacterized protein (UPF0280 family)
VQPQRQALDAGRWHFQHGPIDLVILAEGEAAAVTAAHEAAWLRFQTVLQDLVAELPLLRQPVRAGGACPLRGPVARRMWQACQPLAEVFITPMAAVAGSVAQEIVAFYAHDGIRRAAVNNGGDIALHLAPGESLRVGVFADLARFHPVQMQNLPLDGRFEIGADSPVRGIATSGWRGRSFSLGIADSVTVLATTAAQADAAATVIANAVNLDDARIVRAPACSLKDDSDLGEIAVTVAVPSLPREAVARALHQGACRARALRACGLIQDAALLCQGQALVVSEQDEEAAVGSVFA